MTRKPAVALSDWAVQKFELRQLPLAEMHRFLTGLHALWNEKRESRPFPPKDAIAPRDIKNYLSCSAVLRVVDGGKDFEYRLVGHALNPFGGNLEGKFASEIYASDELTDLNNLVETVYRPVVTTGVPRLMEFRFERPSGPPHARQALYLPLGERDDAVDHILLSSGPMEMAGV